MHGDSLQNELVAIVVPDVDVLGGWVKKHNIPGAGMKEWVKNKKVYDLILNDMNAVAKEAQLRGFEMVKIIHLERYRI